MRFKKAIAELVVASALITPAMLVISPGVAHADIKRHYTRAPQAACVGDQVKFITTVLLTDANAPFRRYNYELIYGDGFKTNYNTWNAPKIDMSNIHIYSSPGVYQWVMNIVDPLGPNVDLSYSDQVGWITIGLCNDGGTSGIGKITGLSVYRDDRNSQGAIVNVTVNVHPVYWVFYHVVWGDGKEDGWWVPSAQELGGATSYTYQTPPHVYDYYRGVGSYENRWMAFAERYPQSWTGTDGKTYSPIIDPHYAEAQQILPVNPYKYNGSGPPVAYIYHIC